MAPDAMFRIASMTKPITAIGIMILADEGKLSPDDPVEKYLPEFKGQMLLESRDGVPNNPQPTPPSANPDPAQAPAPRKPPVEPTTLSLKRPARPITLRDLLTHTSGLPPGYPRDFMKHRDRNLAEGALIMSQQPLNYEPGLMWKYCSSGMDVLGRVIEVVSGKTYEDFLQERVFQPLAMRDTTFYPDAEQRARLAQAVVQKDGQLVPFEEKEVPDEKPKNPNPSGGLYSTAADLSRLYRAMLRGGELDGQRILSENAVKTMTQIQTGDIKCGFTPGMSYGFGFGVVKDPQGVTEMLSPGTYGHGGMHGTQGWMDPKRDVFLILLIQRDKMGNGDASPMRRAFQAAAVKAIQQ